jgi:hypothetical protein
MRAIARRLYRLEERFGVVVENGETLYLRARLEAARRRCGLQPIPLVRLAELRGMSIVAILNLGRQRAGLLRKRI